jgi:hypothetical protein
VDNLQPDPLGQPSIPEQVEGIGTAIANSPVSQSSPIAGPVGTPTAVAVPAVAKSLYQAAIKNDDLPDPWKVPLGESDLSEAPIPSPQNRTTELTISCALDCIKLVWANPNRTFTLVMIEHSSHEGAVLSVGSLRNSYEQWDDPTQYDVDPYEGVHDQRWLGCWHSFDGETHLWSYVLAVVHGRVSVFLIAREIFKYSGLIPDVDSSSNIFGLEYFEEFQLRKLERLGY